MSNQEHVITYKPNNEQQRATVLVIGGAGYIGSHAAKLLLLRGYEPIVLDDLSTGHVEAAYIATKGGYFYHGSYADSQLVSSIIKTHHISTVMHFAAKSLVGESVADPLLYFESNVGGAVQLMKGMIKGGARNLVFSSTCAVFGQPDAAAGIDESTAKSPINPYGRSKLQVEEIIKEVHKAHGLNYSIMRYFNAAGSDPDMELGEEHLNESHLIPMALKSALSMNRDDRRLTVFGVDYATPDGSCIRDYIHVNDLGEAHILAMELIEKTGLSYEFNLGSEKGSSVLEVLGTIEQVTGHKLDPVIGPRRAGDPAVLISNSSHARTALGWHPKFNLRDTVESAWKWFSSISTSAHD
jgi:UDP-glucose 4-epimerase